MNTTDTERTWDEAERAFAGALLSGFSSPLHVTSEMFKPGRNRIIFQEIKRIEAAGGKPDIRILAERLRSSGMTDAAGGLAYVADLTTRIVPANFEYYLGEFESASRCRALDREIRLVAEALQKGENPEAVAARLSPRLTPGRGGAGGFEFERVGSIKPSPHKWIVKNFLEEDSLSCIFGDPAVGKSFIGVELAAAVATGADFYGLPVKRRGPVIYLCGEGQAGLYRRFSAWSIARGQPIENAEIYRNKSPVSLIDRGFMAPMVAALRGLIQNIGGPPVLVIVDTWSRNLGGDDSSPADGAEGLAALDRLRKENGNFAAVIIHHEGHLKGRARGWSGLKAACDSEYHAKRQEGGKVIVTCVKQKDSAELKPIALEFSTVQLGIHDDEGKEEMSAVLNLTAYSPEEIKNPRPLG